MKHYFSAVCILAILAGCGAGSNLNIVSPSASEEEIRRRASEVMSEKSPSVTKEKPAPPAAAPAVSPAKSAPAETQAKEIAVKELPAPAKQSVKGDKTQDALINLLEKKGVITRKELMEEMQRLEGGSK